MKSEIPPLPALFYPSRTKTVLLWLGSVMFVVGGVFAVRHGQLLIGYANICFFGLGVPMFLIQLHPKAAFLLLESDGFTFCVMFRSHKVAWENVQKFALIRMVFKKMVAWDYVTQDEPHKSLRIANKRHVGYEAALPDTYGFKAQELCDLMNQLRESKGAFRA